jgi:hypothetical protein
MSLSFDDQLAALKKQGVTLQRAHIDDGQKREWEITHLAGEGFFLYRLTFCNGRELPFSSGHRWIGKFPTFQAAWSKTAS